MHERLYKVQNQLDDILKDAKKLYDIMDEMAQHKNERYGFSNISDL